MRELRAMINHHGLLISYEKVSQTSVLIPIVLFKGGEYPARHGRRCGPGNGQRACNDICGDHLLCMGGCGAYTVAPTVFFVLGVACPGLQGYGLGSERRGCYVGIFCILVTGRYRQFAVSVRLVRAGEVSCWVGIRAWHWKSVH